MRTKSTWRFFAPSKWRWKAKLWIMVASNTRKHTQIKTKRPNPSQKPTVSSKAPNEDLKDMDVLCTFKIKIESKNLYHGCLKDQWPYPNQAQDAKLQSGTSSIYQSPNLKLKIHGCSLHLRNQKRGQKFRPRVYQRPVTISNSRLRLRTPVSIP